MKHIFTLFFLFAWAMLAGCGGSKQHGNCKTCKDFKTQAAAKDYAKSHKECKHVLDHDNDGKYCEQLPAK
ncbi:MAG TPA: hypothetical protein DCM08_02825 [Microscillaceae bacterium]|jgi:hypothetical protein|nr:hypothetical protein [Microscillaceae bacterium]